MPFIPHTDEEIQTMLASIGQPDIESLFSEIPDSLRIKGLPEISSGMSELALKQFIQQRFENDADVVSFAGAGAYEHHIPAAVWDLVSRGEFLTAYTPYQAESSQGTLQILFEYQTMMASLMHHEVSNASLYDGASALAEAALMAVRLRRKEKDPVIFLPEAVNPRYREVLHSLLKPQGIEIVTVPYALSSGHTTIEALEEVYKQTGRCTALVIPQPNYFGVLEEVGMLNDWAHKKGAISIGQVNPTAMAWLKPPGAWGENGADLACGEGQPLGVPLNRGGPYFGFLTCNKRDIRQLPGRLVGQTQDAKGNRGFTLTLQAREQHIRRGKATSNICTNQGLLVTCATIYMSVMGPEGLKQVAKTSHNNTSLLAKRLTQIPGVKLAFNRPFFHEVAVHCPKPVEGIIDKMCQRGYLAGVNVSEVYPELDHTLLVCATETKTPEQIESYCQALESVLGE